MFPRSILIAALLPITVTVGACLGDAGAAEHREGETAKPTVVRAANLTSGEATVAASGVIEARATADISFQVPGKVVGINADEGQEVVAGQLLAQLDWTDYRLGFEQASLAH